MRLRGVELKVTAAGAAADFLENIWGLTPAGSRGGTRYFRGTGTHPYVLSITEAEAPSVTAITFAGPPVEIDKALARVRSARAPIALFSEFDAPGGGSGFIARGPEAQAYRFITDAAVPAQPAHRDKPIQVTHAVVNTLDIEASERFAADVLGFRLSDRTRIMTFLRCNRTHHSLAYARSKSSSLNHIAFEMTDLDAVMRGLGRMRDAGHASVWGPGRHGPGNNVFGYFVAPFGAVIEYTAEVNEVPDDYKVGSPEDWQWPPGRNDQWGVAGRDMARMSAAEDTFRFSATS